MNIFEKIKFVLKKPKVIIVTGEGRNCATEAIFQVLKQHFSASGHQLAAYGGSAVALREGGKVASEILIFKTDLTKDIEGFEFLLKKSKSPILVVTHIGEIPPDKLFFAGEREETLKIRKLAKILPAYGFLILNFDDETVREIKNETRAHSITYGFQEGADFRASDINIDLSGTNFKIDFKGNIVPFWLKNLFGKEQIYSALTAIAVGVLKDINLVELSQALSAYQSLPGKMRLIKGVKNSLVLDDSENATVFSMIEAIEILEKLKTEGRKITVLGDILGIGKYTIEAHETIGEKVAKTVDLLFTFGQRARFIAQGALSKGMAPEKIFQFNNIEEGKLKLQNEIKEGDLILVDGSKEMNMAEIVKEIQSENFS